VDYKRRIKSSLILLYKRRGKNSPFLKGGFSGIINICKMERFDLVKHYRFTLGWFL